MRVRPSLRGRSGWPVVLVSVSLATAIVMLWAGLSVAAGRVTVAPAPTALPQAIEEPMPDASAPSAEITFAAPQRFGVVTEPRTARRRLYGKGNFVPRGTGADQGFTVEEVDAAGLDLRDARTQRLIRVAVGEVLPGVADRRLAEMTVLDGVDYRYVSVQGSVDPEPRVVEIRTRRAAVVVETPPRQTEIAVAPADTVRSARVLVYPLRTQQRLDATTLDTLRVEGAGRDDYRVSAAGLRSAMHHGEQVVMEAWSTVRPMLSWNHGMAFEVKSPIVDGVLGPRGFRLTSPKLAERAGLEMGDVVLAVNDQPINGFGDVFRLYRQVKADQHLSAVEITLERQGRLVTKTYRIR